LGFGEDYAGLAGVFACLKLLVFCPILFSCLLGFQVKSRWRVVSGVFVP